VRRRAARSPDTPRAQTRRALPKRTAPATITPRESQRCSWAPLS
jgi:hypothetical protein